MKTQVVLLRIAGIISFLFMIFHCMFFKMFDWEHSLSCLSQDNRSILMTYQYISILITGFMALVPWVQARALLISPLKYTVLSFFGLFYMIRIIAEFTYFGFSLPSSPVIIIMCAIPMIFYSIPLFYNTKSLNL